MITNENEHKKLNISAATSRLISLILGMTAEDVIETLKQIEQQQKQYETAEQFEVVFASDGRIVKGIASMPSTDVLSIETREHFHPGTVLTLTFENHKTGRHMKTKGKVVKKTMTGIEVHFDNSALI